MNLSRKNDSDLVIELKDLVREERKILTKILWYLREVESRHLHLERGFPSLFEFATVELGYSTGAAHRRIQAMRLLKALPEMEKKIQSGELSLSNAAQAQSFFRQEDKRRRETREDILSVETKREIVESLVGASSRDCERKLLEIAPEKLKNLLAHKGIEGRMDALLNEMADIALKKLDPEKKRDPFSGAGKSDRAIAIYPSGDQKGGLEKRQGTLHLQRPENRPGLRFSIRASAGPFVSLRLGRRALGRKPHVAMPRSQSSFREAARVDSAVSSRVVTTIDEFHRIVRDACRNSRKRRSG